MKILNNCSSEYRACFYEKRSE